jgi:phospholipid transport system substrate-binding protein
MLALSIAPLARADEISDVHNHARKVLDRVIVEVFGRRLSPKERLAPFAAAVKENFDFDFIGKFVLGPYGREADEKDFRDFVSAFEKLNVISYNNKFGGYMSANIDITDVSPGKKSGEHFVSTATASEGKTYRVVWRLMKQGSSYKVIDIAVEGVSMAMSYKNEYASTLKVARDGGKNPVAALTAQINAKIAGLSK